MEITVNVYGEYYIDRIQYYLEYRIIDVFDWPLYVYTYTLKGVFKVI